MYIHIYIYTYIYVFIYREICLMNTTVWRRCVGCLIYLYRSFSTKNPCNEPRMQQGILCNFTTLYGSLAVSRRCMGCLISSAKEPLIISHTPPRLLPKKKG